MTENRSIFFWILYIRRNCHKNAATKLYRVVLNTERVLAIELLNAAQALEFRRPLRSSKPIEDLLAAYRKHVPFVENDQVMYTLIDASVKFLQTEKL